MQPLWSERPFPRLPSLVMPLVQSDSNGLVIGALRRFTEPIHRGRIAKGAGSGSRDANEGSADC